MYRVISPKKLIEKRAARPRSEIVALSFGMLSEQDLYSYEKGLHRPSDKKLPYLLKALNCTYEQITEPVELTAA
jgi:hypothetical protein